MFDQVWKSDGESMVLETNFQESKTEVNKLSSKLFDGTMTSGELPMIDFLVSLPAYGLYVWTRICLHAFLQNCYILAIIESHCYVMQKNYFRE